MKIEEMTSNYCRRWGEMRLPPQSGLCASPAFAISRKIHLDVEGKSAASETVCLHRHQ